MGMITYAELKEKPKEFLAATGLHVNEFELILPRFKEKLTSMRPPDDRTKKGKHRQRRAGAGQKERLQTVEDKLVFILVYQKIYPLQTMLGLHFGLSQPRANYWVHYLMPILQQVLEDMRMTPERDPQGVGKHALVNESAPDLLIDATKRRRQRPKDAQKQAEHYSGKKKAHTDKNLLLVNVHTRKVVYLSSTEKGNKHDKKIADENNILYPFNATLGKDTGFQGYEPQGVLTFQPKKSQKVKS